MLLGLALGAAACDVVAFVSDPKPVFEQTWNLPADSSQISVASLLPSGVSIYSTPASNPPDSSAFQLSVNAASVSRQVGDPSFCAPCRLLNGQTTIKPAFTTTIGTSASLPNDVVSVVLIGGRVDVTITNSMSFDPLRVKRSAPALTNPDLQGRMVIVISSGSQVIGRDSLNGATTPFPQGSALTRQIALNSANVSGALSVNISLNSPASDSNYTINTNGVFAAAASVPDMRVAAVRVNVVNRTLQNVGADSIPLDGLPENFTKYVVRGGLDMTIINPFNVNGNLDIQFAYSPTDTITKTLNIVAGSGTRQLVTLDSTEMTNLFNASQTISLQVGGSVNSPGPVDLTPRQVLTLVNRLIITIRTPD